MPRGRILELKNNYGIIDTDAYKVEHEWIPFRIEKSMLEEKEGKQYIKYTDEVEFSLSQSQGVRDRDIKEATDIRFIGDEWKYQERIIENNAIQNISASASPHTGLLILVSSFLPHLTFPSSSAIIDLAAFRRCVGL